MIKVGLTGKIASGKTQVENILQKNGFVVFDQELISHDLLENDFETKKQILNKFNTTNRKELAKIVFNNENQLKELEQIIHPKLIETIFKLFENYQKENIIFVSGALLFESKFNKFFDKIIFIDAPFDLRLERLIKRNNYTKQEALLRMQAQKEDNKNKADFIIENTNDLNILEKNILTITSKLL